MSMFLCLFFLIALQTHLLCVYATHHINHDINLNNNLLRAVEITANSDLNSVSNSVSNSDLNLNSVEICDSTNKNNVCDALSIIPVGANEFGHPREITIQCVDRHHECIGFAEMGECEKNPGWMIVNCAQSCQKCELRDARLRCTRQALNVSDLPAYAPGDLGVMFRSLKDRFNDKYDITILSEDPLNEISNTRQLSCITLFSYLMTTSQWNRKASRSLEQSRNGKEAQILEVAMNLEKLVVSYHKVELAVMRGNPDVQAVVRRIEDVTLVPNDNYESFQILRYDYGQRYTTHHDSSEADNLLTCGPRILTFFLYLSDVEEGGETAFPLLGLSVTPRRGRAVLWPSVLDSDPTAIDHRTVHEARPVLKGRKFAANSWIHLYDYRVANLWGCTGSFDELQ